MGKITTRPKLNSYADVKIHLYLYIAYRHHMMHHMLTATFCCIRTAIIAI